MPSTSACPESQQPAKRKAFQSPVHAALSATSQPTPHALRPQAGGAGRQQRAVGRRRQAVAQCAEAVEGRAMLLPPRCRRTAPLSPRQRRRPHSSPSRRPCASRGDSSKGEIADMRQLFYSKSEQQQRGVAGKTRRSVERRMPCPHAYVSQTLS